MDTTPGIYREDYFPPAEHGASGVPVFLGYATADAKQWYKPVPIPNWEHYQSAYYTDGYLSYAVRGFFANEGQFCYVLPLPPENTLETLEIGLRSIEALDAIDLIGVPDVMHHYKEPDMVRLMQAAVLRHCEQLANRFAILDALPDQDQAGVLAQRRPLTSRYGALYYPWLYVNHHDSEKPPLYIPPCGHVAGVYSRTDQRVGVHKAPANEELAEVLDVERNLTNVQQGDLNPHGVNCIRAFPGRGIRVWGARTLSYADEWLYINVQRLFITLTHWLENNMGRFAFEPNDLYLWARIEREVSAYLDQLFDQGGLRGQTAAQAYYVRCNDATNPPEVREAGQVITEIGIAPAVPNEYILIRIIHNASGIQIEQQT